MSELLLSRSSVWPTVRAAEVMARLLGLWAATCRAELRNLGGTMQGLKPAQASALSGLFARQLQENDQVAGALGGHVLAVLPGLQQAACLSLPRCLALTAP